MRGLVQLTYRVGQGSKILRVHNKETGNPDRIPKLKVWAIWKWRDELERQWTRHMSGQSGGGA